MSNRNYRPGLRLPALVLIAVGAGLIGLAHTRSEARATPQLVSRPQARQLGLERAWYAQVRLDRARNHVQRAVLADNRLDVLTTAGLLHEFDALTGETLWITPVGNPNYPSLGPSLSAEHVALLNGSTLYVLDRKNGRPTMVRRVGGAPGAAPALTNRHVFVPLVSGTVEGYPLNEEVFTPWYFQSIGRAMVSPLTTSERVVWATDAGVVYVGSADKPGVSFRLETGSKIAAAAAYHRPNIYVATLSGELFALDESTGGRNWKYATGYPIVRAPATVADRVFVTSQEPALHCVDAKSGTALWEAPNVTQFAAASRSRVYGFDDLGALVVLDAASGALLTRMPTDGSTTALVNDQTDRLYLLSDDGLVQCLHEIGAKEPLYHNPPAAAAESTEKKPAAPAAAAPAKAAESPAAPEPAPAASDEGNPFGGAPADQGDPFGDAPAGPGAAPPVEQQEPQAEEPAAPTGAPVEAEENPFGP